MFIEGAILTAIVDAVIALALEKGSDRIGDWARDRLGLDPTKKALKEALGDAFEQLREQHPDWVAANFDASFFQHEGAPVLALFLLRDGQPEASDLAARWADALNIGKPERRAFYTRELEPIAADFLEDLAHQLKSKAVLREIQDSRALEQATEALQSLRQKLGAEKATFGTRRDYLGWLIDRNSYLDPRGTFQTQRQVQVKLDDVYISLSAQKDQKPGVADRFILEKELADLEAKASALHLTAEEWEDQYEQIRGRFKSHRVPETSGKGMGLAEVVTRSDRVVILGDPGSGKTTLLRYLALKHADALRNNRMSAGDNLGEASFPLYIRIAEYAENGSWNKKSLSDFLIENTIMHECPKNGLSDLLHSELEKGNCLLLLDGLDEIVGADERLGVVKQIEDFVRHYAGRGNRFVVTSRKAGYRIAPLAEPFTHYAVQEMDKTQICHFLERWCQAVEDAQTPAISLQERRMVAKREVESILKAVDISPGVRRLATNPLLLRTLALIHRTSAQLPQKRIELYKLATDTLARTWRTAQGVPESALVKEEYLTPLLSKLAYWLHVNKPTGLATEGEISQVLGEEWASLNDLHWKADEPNPKIEEEVKKFLVAVREHTGLFVERAPKRYGFMHLTFEEYYVARYLVARSKKRAKLIRDRLHQPRWEEPILLALGFVGLDYPKEASDLVETAILAEGEEAKELGFTSSQYEELFGQDYLFAIRCLGDNIPVRTRLLKRLIEELGNECLHSTGSARFQHYRQRMTEKLAYLQGSEGASILLPLLIAALQDENALVRSNAARSLGQLGQSSPEAVAALIQALQDEDADVPSNAARSLGQLGQGSPEVVAALIQALQDEDADVRSNAAASLGQLGQGSPEVVTALIRALQDKDVRRNAARSLGQLGQGSPEVVAALIQALQDEDADVRSQAARSLGQAGQGSPEVVAALIQALQDEDAYVRSQAARSLGQLGQSSPEAVAALIAALQHEDADVRSQAARSLGQAGQSSPDVVAVLIAALQHEDADVRSQAAESLGQAGQGSPEVVAALIQALQDEDAYVRFQAAGSLGQLGQSSPEAVAALIATLQDKDVFVRLQAARSLGQAGQGSPDVVAALIQALQDEDEAVRHNAARSLGQLGQGSPEVVAALIQALQDEDADVRLQAAGSLGQAGQGSPEAVAVLIAALQDKGGNVRLQAAGSLGQLGRKNTPIVQDIEAKLLPAIQDPVFENRDTYGSPAYDYAYEALWSLVVGSEEYEK